MILLTNLQKIYIASIVIAGILAIILILFFLYRHVYTKKHFKETVYFKLAGLAKLNDYLLLNNYGVDFDDDHIGVIDHLLISKKYIYVINDFELSGVVSGDLKDRSLRLIANNKKVKYISNPINYNINLIKRLNLYNRLDQTFVKGIVVVTNDTHVNLSSTNNQFMMLRKKELKKYILKADKDDVKPLKEKDVVNFINKLDRQNQNRKTYDK